jgi:hypothetical protein
LPTKNFKPTIILIVLGVLSLTAFAQKVDTLAIKKSKGLYITDLELIPIENTNQILLKWDAHRNLRTFMVEIRDEESSELLYKEKHYGKEFIFEKEGVFSVYPVTGRFVGVPVITSYTIAADNNFKPQNTARHLKFQEEKKEREELQLLRDQQIALETKKTEEKHDFYATLRGSVTFIVFGIFSFFVVIIIWLVRRYKNRPFKIREYVHKDEEFENLGR